MDKLLHAPLYFRGARVDARVSAIEIVLNGCVENILCVTRILHSFKEEREFALYKIAISSIYLIALRQQATTRDEWVKTSVNSYY